jgi:pimeloyl-ACP methyl ester carboxylesterase
MTDSLSQPPVLIISALTEALAPGALERLVSAAGLSPRTAGLLTLLRQEAPEGTLDPVADRIAGRIREAGAPVDILAEGLAGLIAVRVAAEVPDLVRSVILAAPVGFAQPLSATTGVGERLGEVLRGLADPALRTAALAGLSAAANHETVLAGLADQPDAEALAAVTSWWLSGALDGVEVAARQQELRSLRQPVQLIWGRDDPVAGLDSAFFLLRRLRSVQLRVLPACGHLLGLERPAEVGRILGTFVSVSHEPEHLAPAATG